MDFYGLGIVTYCSSGLDFGGRPRLSQDLRVLDLTTGLFLDMSGPSTIKLKDIPTTLLGEQLVVPLQVGDVLVLVEAGGNSCWIHSRMLRYGWWAQVLSIDKPRRLLRVTHKLQNFAPVTIWAGLVLPSIGELDLLYNMAFDPGQLCAEQLSGNAARSEWQIVKWQH